MEHLGKPMLLKHFKADWEKSACVLFVRDREESVSFLHGHLVEAFAPASSLPSA